MLTTTERLGRTRIRLSPGVAGGRCRIRSVVSQSDPTAPTLRPVIVEHDARGARVSLVPEGALLLAGDAIELDITVDAGARLDLIEPGGTVAFDMRGGTARWDVALEVCAGARVTWAGQPFVVSAGADVSRTTRLRADSTARVALRETLVLGRHGEHAGAVRLRSTVVDERNRPVLVEDLPLDRGTAPALLGGHRVLSSVLSLGGGQQEDRAEDEDRFDLHRDGAVLWRRLAGEAHEADLDGPWRRAWDAVERQ